MLQYKSADDLFQLHVYKKGGGSGPPGSAPEVGESGYGPPPSHTPLLTLSAHAREGYSSHFVCQSVSQSVSLCVTFLFWRRPRFQG